MITPEEQKRQKLFSKSANEVLKVWPTYASFRMDNPTNETDRHAVETLKATADALQAVWFDCQAGKATMDQFEAALKGWRVRRLWAAEIMVKENRK